MEPIGRYNEGNIMKKKTVYVLATYKFKITYEHPEHFESMKADLEKSPVFELSGAGVAGAGSEVFGYSCKRVGPAIGVIEIADEPDAAGKPTPD